jgi:hypothetical protein
LAKIFKNNFWGIVNVLRIIDLTKTQKCCECAEFYLSGAGFSGCDDMVSSRRNLYLPLADAPCR